jgi:hypothetical protein
METNTIDVKSVLEKLGYRLSDFGDSWRTSALYRGGDNPTALKIYKNSGVWTDYVDGNKSMPLAALVQKTLGTTDRKIISEYVDTEKHSNFTHNKRSSKIQMEETYPEEALDRLLPHYKFYNSKKISIGDSMALFENGYKNNLVTFGLDASPKLMTTLITLNPEKIIIATNNDASAEKNRGLESAVKIFIKLLKYFDIESLVIKPPIKNDFGAMQELEIDFDTWYNRSPDKNKMYKYILNCGKQFGKTVFSPTKEKLIKSRILNE